MTKIICAALLIITTLSCQPTIKLIYGIKSPKYYSDDQIRKYSNGIDINQELFRLTEFNGSDLDSFKLTSIPQLRLYTSEGYRCYYDVSCSSGYDDLAILSIDSIQALSIQKENIRDWNAHSYSLETDEPATIEGVKPVYVVFFARYIGRLNKLNAKNWIELIEGRKDVELIVINADITIDD